MAAAATLAASIWNLLTWWIEGGALSHWYVGMAWIRRRGWEEIAPPA